MDYEHKGNNLNNLKLGYIKQEEELRKEITDLVNRRNQIVALNNNLDKIEARKNLELHDREYKEINRLVEIKTDKISSIRTTLKDISDKIVQEGELYIESIKETQRIVSGIMTGDVDNLVQDILDDNLDAYIELLVSEFSGIKQMTEYIFRKLILKLIGANTNRHGNPRTEKPVYTNVLPEIKQDLRLFYDVWTEGDKAQKEIALKEIQRLGILTRDEVTKIRLGL
ncbi:MAG: hypothetical protein HC917_06405 [Richelia sp. SM2_1_7]|nr:hypothetical protein [Richelia sp. SM2_1_7]